MKIIWKIAKILLIVGGINWGLVGLFGFDVVAYLFGKMTMLTRFVYILVGIVAVMKIFGWDMKKKK